MAKIHSSLWRPVGCFCPNRSSLLKEHGKRSRGVCALMKKKTKRPKNKGRERSGAGYKLIPFFILQGFPKQTFGKKHFAKFVQWGAHKQNLKGFLAVFFFFFYWAVSSAAKHEDKVQRQPHQHTSRLQKAAT